MKRISSPRLIGLLLAASLPLAGCGEAWQAETYPASGRLTINGQPATGALVQLVAAGQGPDVRNSRPWGMVAQDGTFQLSTYEGAPGAPPGSYQVTITWPVDAGLLGSPDRLKGKYTNPSAAIPPVTIKPEATAIPPIELTNVAVVQNPKPAPAGRRLGR